MINRTTNSLPTCKEWFYGTASYDREGNATWRLSKNCPKIVSIASTMSFGTGIACLTIGALNVNYGAIGVGIFGISVGVVSAGCTALSARKRYLQAKQIENLRDVEAQVIKGIVQKPLAYCITDDIWRAIFAKLPNKDVLNIKLVCKKFHVVTKQDNFFAGMLVDIWRIIFNKLSKKAILKVALVCKEFCNLASEPSIWKTLIKEKNLANNNYGRREYSTHRQLAFHKRKLKILNKELFEF